MEYPHDGMTTKVYGASDDLVIILEYDKSTGAYHVFDEVDCYDKDVVVYFDDGTKIQVHYGKKSGAIWTIQLIKNGIEDCQVWKCLSDDGEIYSDIFWTNAGISKAITTSKQLEDSE